ncbi:MAG: VOC family protein [Bermanella sp.]
MKEITRINHVGIRVADLERSRVFYHKLGFEFIVGPVGPEPVAIMEHPCGVNINFILNADSQSSTNMLMDIPQKYPGYTHMALEVTDIQAVKQQLNDMAIELSGGPNTIPDGSVFIFIRDPDENVIEFHMPAGK